MNKRGQFFLLAAFTIVSVLVGLSVMYVEVEPFQDQVDLDATSSEIHIESAHVIDRGVYQVAVSEQELENNMAELLRHYTQKDPESDLVAIFGKTGKVKALVYTQEDAGSVGVSTGDSQQTTPIDSRTETFTEIQTDPNDEEITIVIDDQIIHTFQLKPGQNFFIILKRDQGDERFVGVSGSPPWPNIET